MKDVQEFYRRNGGRTIADGDRTLLPSGATSRNDGYGVMLKQPHGDWQYRCIVQRRYATLDLKFAANALAKVEAIRVAGASPTAVYTSAFRWDEKQLGPVPQISPDLYGQEAEQKRIDAMLEMLARIVGYRQRTLAMIEQIESRTLPDDERRALEQNVVSRLSRGRSSGSLPLSESAAADDKTKAKRPTRREPTAMVSNEL
jgi:hypothetical protein